MFARTDHATGACCILATLAAHLVLLLLIAWETWRNTDEGTRIEALFVVFATIVLSHNLIISKSQEISLGTTAEGFVLDILSEDCNSQSSSATRTTVSTVHLPYRYGKWKQSCVLFLGFLPPTGFPEVAQCCRLAVISASCMWSAA